MKHRIRSLALALMACGATSSHADDKTFKLSGFGTLAATHSTEANADFVSRNVPNGPGHSREWDTLMDSKLGLQGDIRFNDQLSAAVQAIAFKRYDNGFYPDITAAHVRYEAYPGLAVRVGRMAMPIYLVSDYRRAGYALPWFSPPVEFYGNGFFHYDGADLTWKTPLGEWALTTQAYTGHSKFRNPDRGFFSANQIFGAAVTGEKGDHTLRASITNAKMKVTSAIDPLLAAYRAAGTPASVAVADNYAVNDLSNTFVSLGYMYAPGDWLVMAELGKTHTEREALLAEQTLGYITIGYRLGSVTPYVTLARRDTSTANSVQGVVPSLDATLNSAIAAGDVSQTRTSLGARWDFMTNMALKTQFDHVNLDSGSAGGLVNRQPGFTRGGSYNLLSVAVDFVF